MSKVKVNERVFTDISGRALIIRHRKSAVFFERAANMENVEMYKPYIQWGYGKESIRGEAIPHYKRSELDVGFDFNEQERKELYEYLKKIASESWASFEPKAADSMGADYDSYWDRDMEDEGNLSFGSGRRSFLEFSAPYQPVHKDGMVRLYKFNKRKLESFIFDYEKEIEKCAF